MALSDIPLRRQPNVSSGCWSNMSLALETGESLMANCQGWKYLRAISKSQRQQRARFYGDPPYSSVRVLLQDFRNWSMMQPCAPCSCTPSKLASFASFRLLSNSACVYFISSLVISWGAGATFPPKYLIFSRQLMAEGAQVSRPNVISGLVALPAWAS